MINLDEYKRVNTNNDSRLYQIENILIVVGGDLEKQLEIHKRAIQKTLPVPKLYNIQEVLEKGKKVPGLFREYIQGNNLEKFSFFKKNLLRMKNFLEVREAQKKGFEINNFNDRSAVYSINKKLYLVSFQDWSYFK